MGTLERLIWQKRDAFRWPNGLLKCEASALAALPSRLPRLASTVQPLIIPTYVIGYWIEDHAHLGELGYTQGVDFDLDVYNGRFCRTPEYPQGIYAYFVTITEDGQPEFPYAIGRQWYGEVSGSTIDEISEETTVMLESGPASEPQLKGQHVDSESDTITLAWSSIEGGQYIIESSNDLENWETAQDAITATSLTSESSIPLSKADSSFYRVVLSAVADYDSEGSAGGGGGPGGGGPGVGGGGAQSGTGNAVDGFVFSFGDMPPMQNLALGIRVGNLSATVVDFVSQGPQGGTLTLSFDDSSLASGTTVTASFSHQPPGRGTIVETSTNTYTKP